MPPPKRVAESKGLTPELQKTYDTLKKVRASKTVSLKPTPLLKTEILGLDGEPQPFRLRYYQVQGTYHLMAMKRMVLGDDTGTGKTIQTIAALCYLWDADPTMKPIILAPKSAIGQWASEIRRFTNGVRPIIAGEGKKLKGSNEMPVDIRTRTYKDWAESPDRTALIINYSLLVRDWNHGAFQAPEASGKLSKQPVKPGLLDELTAKLGSRIVIVADEATAFKNIKTKTWETIRYLSDRSGRAYALTATLLKNNLMEGYCIYKAIRPDLFGTKTSFMDAYCIVKMEKMAGRLIPMVLGYRNLDEFREKIDPFFLGRKKHMVSDELPVVVNREVTCTLSAVEDQKYEEALSGILELGDGDVKDFEEHKALVSLIYCQQVVDSLSLLKFKEGDEVRSGLVFDPIIEKVGALFSKEEALVDLLTDGELEDAKVIVYTRFESIVGRLVEILKKKGIKSVRVTGAENTAKKRTDAQAAFQDLKSDVRVIFITSAGSEAINLQAAAATVFYDLPWSWGEYVQILGRMVRIGSPHKGVLAYHLLATRPGDSPKTIDHHVMKLLRKKKALIDRVLGEAAVGALTFEKDDGGGGSLHDLIRMMRDKKSA